MFTVDGGWGTWGAWGECKAGMQKKKRRCNKPRPKHNGKMCEGRNETQKYCQGGYRKPPPPPPRDKDGKPRKPLGREDLQDELPRRPPR